MEERQLEITIDNVPFRVDSKRGRIIEVSNPQNQIKRQDLKDEGSWYRTNYDKQARNIYHGWLEYGVTNLNVIPMSIPKVLFSPELALDETAIAQLQIECNRAFRGFEVIGSKPAIRFQRIRINPEQKTAAADKRKRKSIRK